MEPSTIVAMQTECNFLLTAAVLFPTYCVCSCMTSCMQVPLLGVEVAMVLVVCIHKDKLISLYSFSFGWKALALRGWFSSPSLKETLADI